MAQPFRVPFHEITQRKERIQTALRKNGIDGLLVIQRVDLFYFSGTAQNGFLYIPAKGEPLLLVKKFFPRAKEESSLHHILEIQSIRELPERLHDFHGAPPRVLGLELDVLPVNHYNKIKSFFSSSQIVDVSPLILETRMIKSDWEIEQMENTADLSSKTFEYMRNNIRPGLSEMEFAGMYETYSRKLGHGALLRIRDFLAEGYPWHVLSGTNGGMVGLLDSPMSGAGTSAAFPCGAGGRLLAANEPIMIDFGAILNGYHIDETRMFVIGAMPERAMKACEAVIEIRNGVLERVKPGATLDGLYRFSVEKAKRLGYENQYLGPEGYKVSFLGHGVGLELVEPPFIARGKKGELRPGMTFAIEPKIIFEHEFAAGIEDVFLVTETGYRMLSRLPVEVFTC